MCKRTPVFIGICDQWCITSDPTSCVFLHHVFPQW